MSNTDALFTRFEELFKKYLESKQFFLLTPEALGIETDKLRRLFHYCCDNRAMVTKEVLLESLQITYPSEMSAFWGITTDLQDHIADSFAKALEELKIEEDSKSEKAETTRLEETDEYVFRLNGDVWTIVYEGKQFPPIKNERGMSLISCVLFNRGTAFHTPLVLEAVLDGPEAESSLLDNMTREQLEKEGFSTQGLVDRQGPDKTAFQAYKKRLDEIDADLAEAARNNDLAQINVLNGEKEALIGEMGNFVIRAQKGPRDHNEEKARKRVSSAIHRALDSIQEHEPDGFGLSSHLCKHLTPVSFPYSYTPDQPIDWTI